MIDNFEFGGHVCIGFELLGLSVFDFLVRFLFITFIIEFTNSIQNKYLAKSFFIYRKKIIINLTQLIKYGIYLTNYVMRLDFYTEINLHIPI